MIFTWHFKTIATSAVNMFSFYYELSRINDGLYKNLATGHVAIISLELYFRSHQSFLTTCLGVMFVIFVSD